MRAPAETRAVSGGIRLHVRLRAPRNLLPIAAFASAMASAVGVASWATWSSFSAKFGPVDDHEALIWMGPDNRLPWSQFWTTFIHKTEVGQWGHTGRFRPSYYFVRVLETVIFGNDPRAWYAWVFILFAITSALLSYVVSMWLATAIAGTPPWVRWSAAVGGAAVGSVLFAGMYAWSGVVGRLGPAELLGLAAAAVALLSLTNLSLGRRPLWWVPAFVAVATATFAKESFFSLGLVFPVVGAYRYFTRSRDLSDVIGGALGLVPAVLLASILAPTLFRRQQDVYGAGVGTSRFAGAASALLEPPVRHSVVGGAVMLIAWFALALTVPKTRRPVLAFLLAVIVWLFACAVLDDWFYGGNYALPRYRAVPDLVATLQLAGTACLTVAAAWRVGLRTGRLRLLALVAIATGSFFLLRESPHPLENLRLTRETAAIHATASIEYDRGLSAAMARLARTPRPTMAVVAAVPVDFELAFAVLNEIARRSDDRVREYLIVAAPRTPGSPLLRIMKDVSLRGRRDWHTQPVRELRRRRAGVCVFLNEHPHPVRGCRPRSGLHLVAQGM